MLYQEVQTVSIVRTPVYYYCSRPESLSWSVDRYSIQALNGFYDQMDKLVTKCGYRKEVKNDWRILIFYGDSLFKDISKI